MAKFIVEDSFRIFSIREEEEFFRLTVSSSRIEDHHIEDFLDTTVEWMSSNPSKGIMIDFTGVKSVCRGFAQHLARYYEDLKRRGMTVRFINVNPAIRPDIDISDITVVISNPLLPEKAEVSAKAVMQELSQDVTDSGLMRKFGLSKKGVDSLFRKLLQKGLITKEYFKRRLTPREKNLVVSSSGSHLKKVTIDTSEIIKDIRDFVPDDELMRKYRVTRRGLHNMLEKLVSKGYVSRETIEMRKRGVSDSSV